MILTPSVGTVLVYCLLPVLFFASLFIGQYPVSPLHVLQLLAAPLVDLIPGHLIHFEPIWTAAEESVIYQVRLPRVIAAVIVGAGLSVAGAAYQGLFKNPLVSPDILGVSSGAGFGAALAILLSWNLAMVQLSAFCFGVLAVTVTYLLSRIYRTTPTLILVLSGIIVAAFFSALISLTKYVADPYEKLPAITFWLMGSLSSVRYSDIVMVIPPFLIATGILLLIRWRINLLAVGDDEARTLGIDTRRMAQVIILCSTLITASAVCIAGIIGWVGLVVPHLGRMLVGPDYTKLLPVCLLLGACYMLIIDDLARMLTNAEIPLGILTAIIGAPFFAYLLSRKSVGWI
ncbi:FecCD family ABC transporter permease [Methanosphaerula palustris]|uniref:Cobalamin import system permease protein BtuC n=1 Tax=Methanosphaerula palustris (strain ATCC BAA-1556 / DSM 19958 / E1-9c) TaxID=521011 RepID=B8GIU3_METPE|nr:iron ABC transporter permease [Methanosphaerula palustris]ACL16906.1 transport system permease protein [Methanosphaerula palustris E1-9c]